MSMEGMREGMMATEITAYGAFLAPVRWLIFGLVFIAVGLYMIGHGTMSAE